MPVIDGTRYSYGWCSVSCVCPDCLKQDEFMLWIWKGPGITIHLPTDRDESKRACP